ncbi:DUF1501 domain-containing protein [Arenicella xantha]|uniref:Uncharacterized protein DUF1501 n=1 Tax=Arenicella xantha TaxID=644221 RepID=A0A395JQ03_9GAMM|nr:DUF1501 domain-containing protein [Arenicella xantha]RBP53740.1 uncharacterized protein DUF1501 [Arenicella xantha]
MDRRQFLQSSLYTSLLFGAGSLPRFVNDAIAGFEPLENRLLVNLLLEGGPDFRHLIVPEFDSNTNSFGYQYWSHRWRSHDLSENPTSWQQRWNDDYYPITVGAGNWTGGLADPANINSGVTFGIWREAGWLIDMFRAGNVAVVCNAVGGTNRAHDLSTLQLNQGNVLSGLNNGDRSGWGGRLARSAGGNMISVTNTPSGFCFGPQGLAPNYDHNAIDNRDLIAVQNSREIGLNEYDLTQNQFYRPQDKMARALKNYYQGARNEQVSEAYEKFMDHESKVREFGRRIREQLADLPEPPHIEALHRAISIDGVPVNPNANNEARRVLRNGYGFGRQIRNLYDVCAANHILDVRAVSMSYGGWDSHGDQRQGANAQDVNDPDLNRGIENGFKDIFGGRYGNTPVDGNALHGGFSALWAEMNSLDLDKMVITVAGEFGRQIRDNGDGGTDHGKGNIMFVIGERVNGGVYGELFPEAEIDKYDDLSLNTPDIDPRTSIDPLFASVCDWVAPNSGSVVFPRTAPGYIGEAAIIESAGMFASLLS